MPTEAIKLAGPDSDGNFKVLSIKNTTLVYPGEVYTEAVFKTLVSIARGRPTHRKLEVTAVEAKLSGTEMARFGLDAGAHTFSEESGGKVLEELR